jgi:D-alanine-D-alanine ligase
MSTKRVGVLRGGPSDEYDVSLKSGAAVLSALSRERCADKYVLRDILIDKNGLWHISGQPAAPEKIFAQTDVLVNALHGAYGEDGKLQTILDEHGVIYTGSRALPSAIGMNKVLAKKAFTKRGIKTPRHTVVENARIGTAAVLDETIRHIFNTFSMPVVVKPVGSGSSVGVSIARSFADIAPAIREAGLKSRNAIHSGSVMVEEYISGKEATVGVIDGFRGESCYTLPAIEIRHGRGHDFFDYEAKYSETGGAEEIVPGHFSVEEKSLLENMAKDIHAALGLRHYSRSDFIVTPRRGIYALEVNTLPGLTPASLLPKALAAVGSNLPDFLDHIIGLALAGK